MKRIIISLTLFLYILNTTVAQYDDSKWELGAEVGITRLDSLDQSQSRQGKIKQSNSGGVAIRGNTKYNINSQFQFITRLLTKVKNFENTELLPIFENNYKIKIPW
jgi:hypothetical protein